LQSASSTELSSPALVLMSSRYTIVEITGWAMPREHDGPGEPLARRPWRRVEAPDRTHGQAEQGADPEQRQLTGQGADAGGAEPDRAAAQRPDCVGASRVGGQQRRQKRRGREHAEAGERAEHLTEVSHAGQLSEQTQGGSRLRRSGGAQSRTAGVAAAVESPGVPTRPRRRPRWALDGLASPAAGWRLRASLSVACSGRSSYRLG